ncbi:MAG: PAS domain S-box protein [Candidatus Omnitrophota bacterium]
MNEIIDVTTGELKAARGDGILRAGALGSCVAVCAYYLKEKAGVLAHITLPGRAPEGVVGEKTKYARDAIEEMLERMFCFGAGIDDIEVCLVGAANVLKRKDDATAENNLDSIVEILRDKKIKIEVEAVGGTTPRSVSFDVGRGIILYTEGTGSERLLWAAEERGLRERIKELEQAKEERRITEKLLRESEERYRAIFEQAIDAIVVVDSETGELVEFNDHACENLGYTREEFQKLKVSDFEVIESEEAVNAHIKKVIEQGRDSFKTMHRTKNGQIRDIKVNAKAIFAGEKVFIMSIWRDITDN